MRNVVRTLALIAGGLALSGCWPYGNEGAQYFYRSDTITLSAGNAKDVNAATHVIDPWPRYVANRRIPANAERMVGGIQRYVGRQGVRASGGVSGPSPGFAAPPSEGAAVPSPR
jgi:hypothetical protein